MVTLWQQPRRTSDFPTCFEVLRNHWASDSGKCSDITFVHLGLHGLQSLPHWHCLK